MVHQLAGVASHGGLRRVINPRTVRVAQVRVHGAHRGRVGRALAEQPGHVRPPSDALVSSGGGHFTLVVVGAAVALARAAAALPPVRAVLVRAAIVALVRGEMRLRHGRTARRRYEEQRRGEEGLSLEHFAMKTNVGNWF